MNLINFGTKCLKGLLATAMLFQIFTAAQASEIQWRVKKPEMINGQYGKISYEELHGANSSSLDSRIVGGVVAGSSEFKEYGSLWQDGYDGYIYYFCGATLIDNKKVLTAAHCTEGLAPQEIYFVPQAYHKFVFYDVIGVSQKKEHPNYNNITFDNDISILTLATSSLSPQASLFMAATPVSEDDSLEDVLATVVGLGVTSEGGNLANTLRKVSVPIIANSLCDNNLYITPSMLCAGLAAGGKDSCQGDSGGPLFATINEQKVQVGIVSWGFGCARPNYYGVYSRISELNSFIVQQAPNTTFVPFSIEDDILLLIVPIL